MMDTAQSVNSGAFMISIKFSQPKSIEQKDIDFFAQVLGCDIPDDLKFFFMEFNGSKPEKNIFKINQNNESGVNELIPISKILRERKYLDHVGAKVFPIAVAEGGNYVVIDLDQNQSVYFWDHEEPKKMIKLANSVGEFLADLIHFDPDSVELEEGQVESVWIDPDFLNSLK